MKDFIVTTEDGVTIIARSNVVRGNSIETILAYHLQYNHYPPVDLAWVDACYTAIVLVEDGDEGGLVATPNAGEFMPAADIIDGLHLESFLGAVNDEGGIE